MKNLILVILISTGIANANSQTNKQIRVNLMDSAHNMFDGTLTEYDDNNNDAIEDRDARKANNFQWNFGLLRDKTSLSIERRKTVDTIFFNMWGMTSMKYSLEINSIGLPAGRLEDKYLGLTYTFGNVITYYPFIVDTDFSGSYISDRFRIIFTLPAANKAIETKVTVFPNPSTKWINYRIDGNAGAYRVYFYNDIGVLVYTRKAIVTDGGFSQRIYLTGGSKFYTLKVVSPDNTASTTKIIIQ